MAFGFSPKHEETFTVNDLNPEEFIALALNAVKQLNWNISYMSEKGFIAYTKISMSSYGEEVKIIIDGNTATIKSECTGSQLFDMGKNKGNTEAFIDTFKKLKETVSKEQLAEQIIEIKANTLSSEEDLLNEAPLSSKDKISGFFSIFKPQKDFFITPILLDLNILVFIIMAISGVGIFAPEGEQLLAWGANFKPSTLNGEWWRVLTCCFIHIGIIHLIMNMYALLYIGVLLEPYLGKKRFLTAYLVTGIAASLTSLMWNDLTISAGASGAIFGMYGLFLAMLTTNLIEKSARQSMLTSIAIFVGYNLLNGMKGGIDNAAHIGGLISGLVVGYCYCPGLKETNTNKYKNMALGFISFAVIIFAFLILRYSKNDIGRYEAKMKEFASMETSALEVFTLPQNTPNDKILNMISNQGIKTWENCIVMIDELKQLDLPAEIQERNEVLKYYCSVRISSYKLLYKAVSENSDAYNSQIDSCNTKIQEILNKVAPQ